jgi:hypothetical protein
VSYCLYTGRFSSTRDLQGLAPERTGELEVIRLPDSLPEDEFGLEFRAVLTVAEEGEYTFFLVSDDGSRLYVDERLIVNNDYAHGARERSGRVRLAAGRHLLHVTYFEGAVDQTLEVSYSGPDFPKKPIPTAVLERSSRPLVLGRDGIATAWLLDESTGRTGVMRFLPFVRQHSSFRLVFGYPLLLGGASCRLRNAGDGGPPGDTRLEWVPTLEKGAGETLESRVSEDGLVAVSWAEPLSVTALDLNLAHDAPTRAVVRDLDLLQDGGDAWAAPVDRWEHNGVLCVVMDVRDAPELSEVGHEISDALMRVYPLMLQELGVEAEDAPRFVRFSFRPDVGVPAYASGDTIVLSRDWFRDHPDDLGVGVHEMAHVIQAYPVYDPSWLVEGIADYVRHRAAVDQRWQIPGYRAGQSYRDGYGVTAGFLVYVSETYEPTLVARLNTALRRDEYRDALFSEITGRTLQELWSEYAITGRGTAGQQ